MHALHAFIVPTCSINQLGTFKACPQNRKKLHPLSERLASLSIMGAQLRASLKSPNIIVLWWSDVFEGALNWAPMMSRDARFSDSYTSNRWCFPASNVHRPNCVDIWLIVEVFSGWKNLDRLFQRLASFDIMGKSWGAPFTLPNTIMLWCSQEFQGCL